MKVNAIAKIYVSDYGSEVRYYWHPKRLAVKDIEYTQTDVYIKKVENFLEMLGSGFTITDNITYTNYGKEQLIEDFKTYMKGE